MADVDQHAAAPDSLASVAAPANMPVGPALRGEQAAVLACGSEFLAHAVSSDHILALQQTAGNRSVTRLLRPAAATAPVGQGPPAGLTAFLHGVGHQALAQRSTPERTRTTVAHPSRRGAADTQITSGLRAAVTRRDLLARNSQALDAGAAPADAGVGSVADVGAVTIAGHDVPADPAELRAELEQRVIQDGPSGPRDYLGELESAIMPQLPIAGPIEDEQLGHAATTVNAVREAVEAIESDIDALVSSFTSDARLVLDEVLKDSETRAKAEAIKYGLTEEQIEELYCADPMSGWTDTQTWTRYDMPDSPAGRGLAAAAAQLLKRRSERIAPLRNKLYELNASYARGAAPAGAAGPWPLLRPPELVTLQAEIKEEEQEYDALAAELAGRYPILGSFTRDKSDTRELERLAAGPSQNAAQLIGTQIAETLWKIDRVRAENAPDGDVNVYKLGQIVALTKARQAIGDDSWQARVIEDQVAQATDSNIIIDIALTLLNLALVALAPATGGASLIVAAGLSTATAVVHAQQYLLEDAMAGSDVDKARALSQDEPSLFWLAVDIVGAAGDIGAGASAAAKLLGIYKSAEGAVRAVQAAKTAEEASIARARLAAALEHEPAVLRRITKSLDEEGRLTSVSKELAAVERAADVAQAELKAGREAATQGGHVHVTKTGRVFSCASPCTEMRARYSEVLASDEGNTMFERLRQIEADAAKLAPTDEAGLDALAKRAAALDDDLATIALRARARKIAGWLPTLAESYPVLKEHPLSVDAIARIIKKTDAGQIKGQLLEELAGAKVQKLVEAGDAAALQTIAGERAGAKLEYVAGHRISDARGRQFTDGMLISRDGEKVEVIAIFESKAGGPASRGLGAEYTSLKPDGTYKSLKDLRAERPLEQLTDAELDLIEARRRAIETLRERNPGKYGKMSIKQLDEDPAAQAGIARVMDKMVKTEAGQAVRDIERGAEVGFKIDGQRVERAALGRGSTKVVGVLPTDVNAAAIEAKVGGGPKGQGLNFGTMNVGLDSRQLSALAGDIAERAKAPTL
jgi:hypothetical protein